MSSESAPRPFASDDLAFLRLSHLTDSALPIGALAQSFGLETLVSAEMLKSTDLPDFFEGYLQECGMLDATDCRSAFRLVDLRKEHLEKNNWLELNDLLSALKPARESRAVSAALGRNFLSAVINTGDYPMLLEAREAAQSAGTLVHHAAAFGLVSAVLGFGEDRAALAYLHQAAASFISACQRLLPLGQTDAMQILWNLKPAIIEVACGSKNLDLAEASCFMPVLDWGAMEHPFLATRLFIS
jgi:urease accessory protein